MNIICKLLHLVFIYIFTQRRVQTFEIRLVYAGTCMGLVVSITQSKTDPQKTLSKNNFGTQK